MRKIFMGKIAKFGNFFPSCFVYEARLSQILKQDTKNKIRMINQRRKENEYGLRTQGYWF